MSKVRVNAFGISIDGYGAGPHQDLANPMGVGGMALHQVLASNGETVVPRHSPVAAQCKARVRKP